MRSFLISEKLKYLRDSEDKRRNNAYAYFFVTSFSFHANGRNSTLLFLTHMAISVSVEGMKESWNAVIVSVCTYTSSRTSQSTIGKTSSRRLSRLSLARIYLFQTIFKSYIFKMENTSQHNNPRIFS